MTTVEVHPDKLRSLGHRLRDLATSLRQTCAHHGGVAPLLGEPVIADALQSVERDWSTKRDQITSYLEGCGDAAVSAADAYAQAEASIVQAAGC